jgi:hypothetical protein
MAAIGANDRSHVIVSVAVAAVVQFFMVYVPGSVTEEAQGYVKAFPAS